MPVVRAQKPEDIFRREPEGSTVDWYMGADALEIKPK